MHVRWLDHMGDAENAGLEKAGLENAGTSCVWVAKCNIINVRGHVRVNVVVVVTFFNHNFVNCKATLIVAIKMYEIKIQYKPK